MSDQEITVAKIEKEIKSLENNKTPGNDEDRNVDHCGML